MARIRIDELARKIGCKVQGDHGVIIRGAAPIDEAREGDLTFLGDAKLKVHLSSTNASAVIVKKPIDRDDITFLLSENPYLDFARALSELYPRIEQDEGISEHAIIEKGAKVSDKCTIYPFVFVGSGSTIKKGALFYPGVYVGRDVEIGENSILFPSVTVYDGSKIGNNVVIHAGSVIGSDGFGYARKDGKHVKIPQVGSVVIEDDVEIGANTTIDRAAMGETRIRKGTKIDNLVHVGHNVKIGNRCIIAAQSGMAGSAEIGDHVMLGGQTGVAGHLTIDSGIMVGAKSGIPSSLSAEKSKIWSGIPVIPHKKWLKLAVNMEQIPDLVRKVKYLEAELEKMKGKSGG